MMKIVKRPDGNVTAYFNHTCGHGLGMLYGGEEFAERERPDQESKECISCRNKHMLEAFRSQQ